MSVNAKWDRVQESENEERKKAYAGGDKETMAWYSLIILLDTHTHKQLCMDRTEWWFGARVVNP